MSRLVINKLHNNINEYSECNYYSIRILNSENSSENEIMPVNDIYFYSLTKTPTSIQDPDTLHFTVSDNYRLIFIPKNDDDSIKILKLFIKVLKNTKYVDIYSYSCNNNNNFEHCQFDSELNISENDEFVIRSKYIQMSTFYEMLYSIIDKIDITTIVMFECDKEAFKFHSNLKAMVNYNNPKVYSINDYKNIGSEYSGICDAYISDLKNELYIKTIQDDNPKTFMP